MAYEEYQPTPLQPPVSLNVSISSIGGLLELPYDQKGEYRIGQKFGDEATPILNKFKNNQPFNPTTFLKNEEVEGESVQVPKIKFADGYVIERAVKNSVEQIIYSKPSNNSNEFTIASNDAFYVEFNTDKQGNVSTVPLIVKKEIGASGDRFYPDVGSFTGQSGKFIYKLCEIHEVDNVLLVTRFHCGDNIHHVIDRVTMTNLYNETGEFYDVLKDYDEFTDEVNFRTLEQLGEPGIEIISPTSSGDKVIAFRRVKERSDYSAQVKVLEDADAILIQGNGQDGSLTGTNCTYGGSPIPLISWEDGLITSGDININLLPNGVLGDVLYHDGNCWVTLNKPATSTTHVLAISGNVPYWLETEECDESPPP